MLEAVPGELARVVTDRLGIPTIGIGAGPDCDGQIQVVHDILGFGTRQPRHAKQYAQLNDIIRSALTLYSGEVAGGAFPTDEHTVAIDDEVLRELLHEVETDV